MTTVAATPSETAAATRFVAALQDVVDILRRGDERSWDCALALSREMTRLAARAAIATAEQALRFPLTDVLLQNLAKCPPDRRPDLLFALSKFGDGSAVAPMMALAGPSADFNTRTSALLAARMIGGPAGVHALLQTMTDADDRCAGYAVAMLIELLAPPVDDPLEEATVIPDAAARVVPLIDWARFFAEIADHERDARIERLVERLAEVARPADRAAWNSELAARANAAGWPAAALTAMCRRLQVPNPRAASEPSSRAVKVIRVGGSTFRSGHRGFKAAPGDIIVFGKPIAAKTSKSKKTARNKKKFKFPAS